MKDIVSMFNEYANEKGFGPRILYSEGVGFATYHMHQDECYIEDIYIIPEKRKSNEAANIANSIIVMAKERGLKLLTGSVNLKANGKDSSMRVLLAYGMSPVATNGDLVYFSKEI
jgi:hypothetical protein